MCQGHVKTVNSAWFSYKLEIFVEIFYIAFMLFAFSYLVYHTFK